MPDVYGFDHLPSHGEVSVRCVECDDARGPVWKWTAIRRARHQAGHVREQEQRVEKERLANLREARRLKRQAARENRLAYGAA
jgi:hypothetical protein